MFPAGDNTYIPGLDSCPEPTETLDDSCSVLARDDEADTALVAIRHGLCISFGGFKPSAFPRLVPTRNITNRYASIRPDRV
jgi:hypothetical protein